MPGWWTYRPSDLLLFSARTYFRLFELHHEALWPAQIVAAAAAVALLLLAWRAPRAAASAGVVLLALAWAGVGSAFHLQRYATVNWAAPAFAAAFGVEALILLALAWPARGRPLRRDPVGLALLLLAIVLQPLIGLLAGRDWRQLEAFALTPDPTAVATLGWLLLVRGDGAPRTLRWALRLAWIVPLLWCGVGGATLWLLGSPEAAVPLAALVIAPLAAWRRATAR